MVGGVEDDPAPDLLDDAANEGEPEPGAGPSGGEERVEDALSDLGRDGGTERSIPDTWSTRRAITVVPERVFAGAGAAGRVFPSRQVDGVAIRLRDGQQAGATGRAA